MTITSNKSCASCGEAGHQRSSSKKCKNYQPRQGAQKPQNNDEEEFYLQKEVTVYKQGLATFTSHEFQNGETLQDRIHQQVDKVTKNSYYVTRLLNFHLQRCIEEDLEFPEITDRTWLRQLFTRKFKDKDLQHSYDHIEHLLPPLPPGINPQITTLFCRDYSINLQVHLDVVYQKMNKRAIWKHLEDIGTPKKEIRGGVDAILETPEEYKQQYPSIIEGITDQNLQSKIKRMYNWNVEFAQSGTKLFNLAPQYSSNAKYITIDTDVLFALIKSDAPEKNKTQFGKNREDQWRKYTNVKDKYFKDNKRFNCEIKTDGVGCSVELFTWKSLPKKKLTENQKLERRNQKEALQNEIVDKLNNDVNKVRIVGCDPGRKDILSAVDSNDHKFVLSNKKYYRDCKFKERQRWKIKQLAKLGIHSFLLSCPTSKTATSAETVKYLEYLVNNQEKMELLFELESESRTRHKRWRSYIHKQKTLDSFCNQLIDGQKENTIFSYGDASFCHNSKGYDSSLKGNWIKHRLQKVHKCNLIMMREFNTSQVCSACHHDKKLVAVGSSRDPRCSDFPHSSRPQQPHFVRRCKKVYCA